MIAPSYRIQKTIKVDDTKIKIVVSRVTRAANFIGWNVKVNTKKYFFNVLTAEEAMDKGFVKFVKGTF